MFDQQVTFLGVNDLSQCISFYEDLLNLPLALNQGSCRIYKISTNGFLGLCEGSSMMPPSAQGVIITLVTQDVDGWYERLKAKGVVFEKPPTQNTQYNIYQCFLRDPEGHLLEIQRFNDPAWPKP